MQPNYSLYTNLSLVLKVLRSSLQIINKQSCRDFQDQPEIGFGLCLSFIMQPIYSLNTNLSLVLKVLRSSLQIINKETFADFQDQTEIGFGLCLSFHRVT